MGVRKREEDVLKLVHPRGYVESYGSPITAAEVMKKYPRHWVTRPDVFKYPWIVVKPESILKLGNVFYIVPNHTIYRLLQAYKYANLQPPIPPPFESQQPHPTPKRSLTPKRSGNKYRCKVKIPHVKYCLFSSDDDDDGDDGDGELTSIEKSCSQRNRQRQFTPVKKGATTGLEFKKHQEKVMLKPCLKDGKQKLSEPNNHKKVTFLLPDA